jgi:hypothetical protein
MASAEPFDGDGVSVDFHLTEDDLPFAAVEVDDGDESAAVAFPGDVEVLRPDEVLDDLSRVRRRERQPSGVQGLQFDAEKVSFRNPSADADLDDGGERTSPPAKAEVELVPGNFDARLFHASGEGFARVILLEVVRQPSVDLVFVELSAPVSGVLNVADEAANGVQKLIGKLDALFVVQRAGALNVKGGGPLGEGERDEDRENGYADDEEGGEPLGGLRGRSERRVVEGHVDGGQRRRGGERGRTP